jgi:signal transduction histidine kinase
VLGFSELLLKRDFDPVERQEMVGIIHRQTSRLVNLVNEMLDLARIESGGRDALHLVAQDAGAVLEQTLSGLDGLGATHRIRRFVEPDLPPVLADAAKLQQALTNIISNAIKYSADPSEIRVSLFATTLDGAAAVGFRVADGGIGMTPDQKAKVFEAFYRAHEDQDNVGTGLGMTIFKEIIDLHHGVIQIESTPGIGTEVTLLLPAAAGTA